MTAPGVGGRREPDQSSTAADRNPHAGGEAQFVLDIAQAIASTKAAVRIRRNAAAARERAQAMQEEDAARRDRLRAGLGAFLERLDNLPGKAR